MITYQVEQWRDAAPEMAELWQRHWEEVAINRDSIKLAVDHKSYEAFADAGALHVVTARSPQGLIGYRIDIVRPHLHYVNDLHAFTDVYYIAPEHRNGWVGVKLIKTSDRTLKARGVKKVLTGTKLHLDMGRLLEHQGYHETERLYTKVLNDQDAPQPSLPSS